MSNSLQQIREEEAKGEKALVAAQAEASKIFEDARAKESTLREKVAAEADDRETSLREQTLAEVKKIVEAGKTEIQTQVTLLRQTAADSQSAAVDFILAKLKEA